MPLTHLQNMIFYDCIIIIAVDYFEPQFYNVCNLNYRGTKDVIDYIGKRKASDKK